MFYDTNLAVSKRLNKENIKLFTKSFFIQTIFPKFECPKP